MKSNRFKIRIEPYGAELVVIFSENVPNTVKKLNKEKEVDESDQAVFIYEIPDTKKYIIVLPYNVTPGLIAHECAHLCTMLLSGSGVDIIENDEPYSYQIGYLVDTIWERLVKIIKKKERLEGKDDTESLKK